MKPTLQEEIGMSVQGIDYVNSLEVKEAEFCITEEIFNKATKNNIPELAKQIERERILKQSRRCWIGVGIIAIILVTLFKMT